MRRPVVHRRRLQLRDAVELADAVLQLLGPQRFRQPGGQRPQHRAGVELGQVRQQPAALLVGLADDARTRRLVVQRLPQLRLDHRAAVLDHHDLLEPAGEFARGDAIQRPGQPDLPDAQPGHPRELLGDAGVVHAPGAASHSRGRGRRCRNGLRAVQHDAVQPVRRAKASAAGSFTWRSRSSCGMAWSRRRICTPSAGKVKSGTKLA